jgi:hypothetical protein
VSRHTWKERRTVETRGKHFGNSRQARPVAAI